MRCPVVHVLGSGLTALGLSPFMNGGALTAFASQATCSSLFDCNGIPYLWYESGWFPSAALFVLTDKVTTAEYPHMMVLGRFDLDRIMIIHNIMWEETP
ncbi:MAG: hypothetical protein GX094_10085 [Clostridiales bacterium]|nr:hypothetical protein [Clostridiales bacterium]